jgi:hypothetical protein
VHLEVAAILGNYAELLRKMGRGREARDLQARAVEIRKKTMRENGVGYTIDAGGMASFK